MAGKNKMGDAEFSSLIEELSAQCYGADLQGLLQTERANAIARYNTEPWGDEVDGRSQLKSSVVRDTVEEAIPQLMRVFLAGDEVVQFDPIGPEDEQQAEQETKYINHIISEKNPAFEIFSTWFRDALLQKNGYVIAYPEEKTDVLVENYYGQSDDALAMILADGESEVIAQTSYPDPFAQQAAQMAPQGVQIPQQMPMLHDVKIKRLVPRKRICIENVPPEEIRVHVTTRSIQPSGGIYTEYRRNLTLSEIRQLGYKVEDDEASVEDEAANSMEILARNRFENQVFSDDASGNDPSTQRALFRMIWIRADRDGDGIAELLRVVKINERIVFEEETDIVPVAAITPIIQPHRHIGYGYYDFLKEIESAATAMVRAYFDNVYLANNGRYGVNVNNVNIDDMLVSKPGGLVRVNGEPGANIFPLQHSSNGSTALEALQFLENWKKQATGVMSDAQSLSSDVLSKAPMGSIAQVISVWQARVEGVARCFAETGVKELFRIVHALVLKHADKPDKAKIGGQWVTVDPREWVKRESLTVTVGLGTGSKEAKVAFLQQMAQQQAQAIPLGIATPKNIYETAIELTKEMGYKDGQRFWTDPEQSPPQPQQPAPEVLAAQEQAKGLVEKAHVDGQYKLKEKEAELALDPQKMAQEAQIRAAENEQKVALEIYKINKQAEVELQKEAIKAQYTVEAAKQSKPAVVMGEDDETKAAKEQQSQEGAARMESLVSQIGELVAQLAQTAGRPKRVRMGPRGPDGSREASIE